jgi:regulator of protease activity HflC (stomatin/prohibitin superfamily)
MTPIAVDFLGVFLGFILAAVLTLLFGVYTIGPAERGVLTTFGRAPRLQGSVGTDPELAPLLTPEEKPRYDFPLIQVVKPGGPYFKWPWQRLYRIDMTIQTTDIVWDPDVNQQSIEAVTKDNLTISLTGQIRWKPCERNLYGYLFGVARPRAHVMGYFISVLRDRIATFHSQGADKAVDGISINDLRKNLSSINQFMEAACKTTAARYGIELEAALLTTIDPPPDVDDALASINTTQNQVAAAISQARADADQKLTMAEQAVQIARNMADADAAPILELGRTLAAMHAEGGQAALDSYIRNALLPLREKASQTIISSLTP